MTTDIDAGRTDTDPAHRSVPLRVALLMSGLPSSGAETVVVRSLAQLRDLGVDPVLITLNTRRDGALADEVRAAGVRRIDIGAHRLFELRAIWRLATVLRRERFDLIHASDQDAIVLGGLLRRITRIPLIMSRHVLAEPADNVRERVRARLVLAVARWVADHVIVVAAAVGATLTDRSGVPAGRITTVHNGVAVADYSSDDRDAVRQQLGWPHDQPVVLMIAWFREGKGHDLLSDIVPRVRARVPGVVFALAGDGDLRPDITRQLAPYAGAVRFLGHRTDIPSLLATADVVLLPSWSEALPTVLIEAGAAGLPVVASDVGGTGEIVDDTVTGHLVTPGDSAAFADRLIALLRDPATARVMGARARTTIGERFTVADQAEATVAVYRRVVREARDGW